MSRHFMLHLVNNGSAVGLATLRRNWSMAKATAPQERAPTSAAAGMLLTSEMTSKSFLAFLTGFLAVFLRALTFFDGFAFFVAFFAVFAAAFFAFAAFLAAAFFAFASFFAFRAVAFLAFLAALAAFAATALAFFFSFKALSFSFFGSRLGF